MPKPLYLGKQLVGSSRFLLDGDQLVTHGVVLGMTGSGKTGLCMDLLEELVDAGVPLLLIDPKGDLPNLGLIFPELDARQFEPWIDPQEAQRQGKTPAQLASESVERYREQLAQWELPSQRLAGLRDKMELRVYTPGASAGIPINLLGSFARPASQILESLEARTELISGIISGLLSLVGVSADPLRSPEHIVLSQILDVAWTQGEDVSLETLVVRLVDPPFKKVGVFPLDTFYPADKRMELALRLNGVLASPSFSLWTQGEPLDPSRWCQPREGKVPVSIFYLAHLSDAERMFFVALLLERVLAYTRTLSGTTALRSLLYFDEVAGYLPPHPGNPASKRPLLTLMKQARAVGFGVVLATQNPVDIDYKGLANAGTWMIGRMQTAQDRERVADGLVSAAAGVDRAALLGYFEQLKPRLFLVKGPAADKPVLIQTRQAMSFLRGPLTRTDLERLNLPRPEPVVATSTLNSDARPNSSRPSHPPVVPSGFAQLFVDPRVVFSARLEGAFEPFAESKSADGRMRMRPALFAELQLRFDEERSGFVLDERIWRVFFPIEEGLPQTAFSVPFQDGDLLEEPIPGADYPALPTCLDEERELKSAQKSLIDEVFRNVTESQWVHTTLKLYGYGGDSRAEFSARVEAAIQERIDHEVGKLQGKYDRQISVVYDKIRKLQARAFELEEKVQSRKVDQLWNAGAAVLGFFTGSKRSLTNVVGSAISKDRQKGEALKRHLAANQELAALEEKVAEIQARLEAEQAEIAARERALLDGIEERPVRLEMSDIRVVRFGILWVPVSRRI